MPKAVKDIELTNMPASIVGLDSYDGVFVLLRYHNKPVGKIILPVKNGSVSFTDHLEEIEKAVGKQVKQEAVNHFLFSPDDNQSNEILHPVTVAICTRNRTNDLKHCLDALMCLRASPQEIIVVDNAPSTDDTKKLVGQYPAVRYVFEERKGLNVARNRAMAEAANDIIAFTDDDATPDPGWLYALAKNFDDPMVMCVTGMTMPLELETEAQEAFEDYSPFGKGFSKKHFSYSSSNPLAVGGIGAGANMAVRKSVTEKIGWFDEALDAGTPTQSGGDHEFFARILLRGYDIVYDPEALSWHRHRRTWKEAVQAIKGYGIGVYAFWSRLFFIEKQYSTIKLAKGWLLYTQLPNFYRSVFRWGKKYPLSFLIAEFVGCIKGPFAYLESRRRLQSHKKQSG